MARTSFDHPSAPHGGLASFEQRLAWALERSAANSSLGPTADRRLAAIRNAETERGVVLLPDMPIGRLPATPSRPGASETDDVQSELTLLSAARQLGEPVGYLPELGGLVVQDLVPTRSDAAKQTSTSSTVRLGWHTETAFHPHMPRFLLLLCLRGDSGARTLFACVEDIVSRLDPHTVRVLRQPVFQTGVDESFTGGRAAPPCALHSVLDRHGDRDTLRWDEILTTSLTDGGAEALAALSAAVDSAAQSVVLQAGDLLVIDNHRAVHGRSPFSPRFDGTDRWLQRAFVVEDLAPSADDRRGRVICTQFTT